MEIPQMTTPDLDDPQCLFALMALRLYSAGFNTFPLPYGQKGGYPWADFKYARLLPEQIIPLFSAMPVNIGIMTGRTSGNLFVIDCETEGAYEWNYNQLKAANIPIFAVRTGGGGGHFYLRCIEGEVENIASGERAGYEIRGNRCYVVAPPSLHPSGRHYTWAVEADEVPQVRLSDVPWLNVRLASKTRKPFRRDPLASLSGRNRDFLLNGAPIGERNNRLFAAACDMAGNNFSHIEAERHLIPAARRSGLPDQEIQATITSAYDKVRQPAKPDHARGIHQHEKVRAWVDMHRWPGRAGATNRSVMLACTERAQSANGEGTFRASCREIAELAGINHNTAATALRRLSDLGYLQKRGRDSDSGANLYAFGEFTLQHLDEHAETITRICKTRTLFASKNGVASVLPVQTDLPFSHDAAEVRALGKTAYYLLRMLYTVDVPLKVVEMAELFHLRVHQVYHALRKLKAWLLVERVDGFRYVLLESCRASFASVVETIAEWSGTLGAALWRRERHDRDRSLRGTARVCLAMGLGIIHYIIFAVRFRLWWDQRLLSHSRS